MRPPSGIATSLLNSVALPPLEITRGARDHAQPQTISDAVDRTLLDHIREVSGPCREKRWLRLRMLQYCCRIWERDRRRYPDQTELRPIVPLVFFQEVLPELKLSVSEAARRPGVSRQQLHRILSCTHPITVEMALRIGKLAGNGPGIWLRMQQHHDLWYAEQALQEQLDLIRPAAVREV